MKHPSGRFRRCFSLAPLAAGLLFFAAVLRADAPPPGRSVAPASVSDDDDQSISPVAQAVSGLAADVSEQDARLRAQDRRLREQDGRLQDQAVRLSSVAGVLDETSAALASNAKAQERLEEALEGLRTRIEGLERKSLDMDEVQAKAAVSTASGQAQQQQMAQDIVALKQDLSGNEQNLAAGLKELRSTRAALAKLDSMDELLVLVKRDEESNDEELVEMKQSLQQLQTPPSSDNAVWWNNVLSWKYLPAVATGLGVVALSVAAFNH